MTNFRAMMVLPHYQILAKIYESDHFIVYRGIRQEIPPLPVILKLLKGDYPAPDEIAHYQQTYQMTQQLNLPGIVKAYSLEKYQNTLVMVLEDFGGESLQRLMYSQSFSLVELLILAIQIVKALGQLHSANIVHKDINPSNIIFNPTTGVLKITDLEIATSSLRESSLAQNPSHLEGTLAYMSPEQTGRMNRILDYRTDYYALGVTLYELFTHHLPFETTDMMELIHCHLAKSPTPPHLLNREIPQMVSAIIMKLLEKMAEARYQSAHGIEVDLQICLDQFQRFGKIENFELGESDLCDKFQLPQKLYGRERELQVLLYLFDKVCQGQKALLLICGYSGIGKTSLVQEIYTPVTQRNGYFAQGKFDRFQYNVPYSAIIKCFKEVVQYILTESELQLQRWRSQLQRALGDNAQVIIDVIPELEFVVGKQSPLVTLSPIESRNRFNLVFQSFVKVLAQAEHPLTLFLDEVEWADSASLQLIKVLETAPEISYLLIIVAYRDNEIEPHHPLSSMIEEMREAEVDIQTLYISPLNLSHIIQLISDATRCSPIQAHRLAHLVFQKTQGNPFFIKEFLQSLYDEKLLYFGTSSLPLETVYQTFLHGNKKIQKPQWQWDLEAIRKHKVTENVVELLTAKIRRLRVETQQILLLAACIGNRFILKTLTIVSEKLPREIMVSLREAMVENLILPVVGNGHHLTDNGFKIPATSVPLDDLVNHFSDAYLLTREYMFAHERIRQAAYSLIPHAPKQAVHQRVGQLLLQSIAPEQQAEKIFDIVNQLNLGMELIDTQERRDKLAELNLLAGQRAKASTAYEPAFNYFNIAYELMGKYSWTRHYELALTVTTEAAEAAYLCFKFEQAEALIDQVLQQAQSLLDKIKAYEIRMQAYKAQNRHSETVELGLMVLSLLGIRFPKKLIQPTQWLLQLMMQGALIGKNIESLGQLPEMNHANMLAAQRIMLSISPSVYAVRPQLLPALILKRILLSLRYGNAVESVAAYASYGYLLCEKDIEKGYQFGQLAIRLLQQSNTKGLKARIFQIVYGVINHHKEHLNTTLNPLLEAYQDGLETGNFEYAAFSAVTYIVHAYFAGKELSKLHQEITTYHAIFLQLKQKTFLPITQIYQQTLLNLSTKEITVTVPTKLIGSAYHEEQMLPRHLEAQEYGLVFRVYLQKLILSYLFRAFHEAYDNAVLAERYLKSVIGSLLVPIFHFYDSLARLAKYDTVTEMEQQAFLKKVLANQKKMKQWAKHAPMNYLHKFYLIEAEIARIRQQESEACTYYEKAVTLARQNEYVHEEALILEVASRFHLSKGQIRVAQVFIRDAHHAYLRWGALAKTKDLENHYPEFFTHHPVVECVTICPLNTASSLPPNFSATKQYSTSALDLGSVLKASQVIAGEIVLKRLLEKLMNVIVENAGAQNGFLLLNQQGEWLIEAKVSLLSHDSSGEQIEILQSAPLEENVVPTRIVYYVARTKEFITLSDASNDNRFSQDTYIARNKPKSVLCMPLINQTHITGILYLENNLMTGAFTPDRLETLNLLSAQIAISIENARLYANLEEKVKERTKDIEAKNQELVQLNTELVKLNQDKNEFLAIAAHDLKNPLLAIQGSAELIRVAFDDFSKDEVLEFAAMIETSSQRMFELIKNLLDVNAIESGKMNISLNQVDILPILQSLIESYLQRSLEKKINLNLLFLEEEDYFAYVDENTVRQVFDNLISNAIKYSPFHQTVNVRLYRNQQSIYCAIQDRGPGLSKSDQEKLFGKFARLTPQPTGNEHSTGLGLFIAKKLVEAMNGRVWCESELGVGSIFIVELPTLLN